LTTALPVAVVGAPAFQGGLAGGANTVALTVPLHGARVHVELPADRYQQEREDGEVEGVEGPAEPARCAREPLVLGRLSLPGDLVSRFCHIHGIPPLFSGA